MKHFRKTLAALLLSGTLLAPVAHAQDSKAVDLAAVSPGRASAPVTASNLPAYLDEDLASKHANFSKFARGWIRNSNRHHICSKSRMQIKRQSDGTYSAIFHRSDENDVICTVKKSNAGTYTAVLRYKEVIYKTVAASPEACRTSEFLPSLINRRIRIFKLKGNTWQ